MSEKVEPEKLPPNYKETKVDEPIKSQPVSLQYTQQMVTTPVVPLPNDNIGNDFRPFHSGE